MCVDSASAADDDATLWFGHTSGDSQLWWRRCVDIPDRVRVRHDSAVPPAATLGVVAGLLAAAVPASAMPIYVQYPIDFNALGTQIGALGIVKSFDSEKGSGFIVPDNGPDVYFHSSALKETGLTRVEAGQRVAFKVTQFPRGPQAEDVRLAGKQVGSRPPATATTR